MDYNACYVHECNELNVAGVEGVDPSSQVLETRILPLNYTPIPMILADMKWRRLSYFSLLVSLCSVCFMHRRQYLEKDNLSGVLTLFFSET